MRTTARKSNAQMKDLKPLRAGNGSSQPYKDVHEGSKLIPPNEKLMSQNKELVRVRTGADTF